MCGILITNKNIQQLLQNLQEYLKTLILRGPDGINHVIINNFLCLHTLLSITKNNTNVIIKQPFVYENGKYIVLYNGEIYNYKEIEKKYTKNYIIDGECIYDLYKEHNYDFIKYLDGEFAIILIDFVKNIIVYSTDIFSTKPLWLSFNKNTKEIGLCSYESILKKIGFENIIQLNPNEINVIDLITFNNIYKNSVYNFDLNQHKENYNDFLLAFQKSVVKRTRIDNLKNNIGICMGLSSGYDSGCLCNELWKQKINFTSYTIYGIENLQILSQRKKLYKQNVVIGVNSDIINKQRIKLEEMEEYNIDIDNGEQEILNKLYG